MGEAAVVCGDCRMEVLPVDIQAHDSTFHPYGGGIIDSLSDVDSEEEEEEEEEDDYWDLAGAGGKEKEKVRHEKEELMKMWERTVKEDFARTSTRPVESTKTYTIKIAEKTTDKVDDQLNSYLDSLIDERSQKESGTETKAPNQSTKVKTTSNISTGPKSPKKSRGPGGCGKCIGCTADNCLTCSHCKDMKRYGGPSRLRKRCKQKACRAWLDETWKQQKTELNTYKIIDDIKRETIQTKSVIEPDLNVAKNQTPNKARKLVSDIVEKKTEPVAEVKSFLKETEPVAEVKSFLKETEPVAELKPLLKESKQKRGPKSKSIGIESKPAQIKTNLSFTNKKQIDKRERLFNHLKEAKQYCELKEEQKEKLEHEKKEKLESEKKEKLEKLTPCRYCK